MSSIVNTGPRLDRLPLSPLHHRILLAIGVEPAGRRLEEVRL